MGFFRDMFRTASEVANLTSRCVYLEGERTKLEWKIEQLEAEVRRERKRYDAFQRTYFNQISVKNGLYGAFDNAGEDRPKTPETLPPEITPIEEETLRSYAVQLQEDDRAQGIDRPLSDYLAAMKEQPERYLDVH